MLVSGGIRPQKHLDMLMYACVHWALCVMWVRITKVSNANYDFQVWSTLVESSLQPDRQKGYGVVGCIHTSLLLWELQLSYKGHGIKCKTWLKSWRPRVLDEHSCYRKYLHQRMRDKHKNRAAWSTGLVDYTDGALIWSGDVTPHDSSFRIICYCLIRMRHDIDLPYYLTHRYVYNPVS